MTRRTLPWLAGIIAVAVMAASTTAQPPEIEPDSQSGPSADTPGSRPRMERDRRAGFALSAEQQQRLHEWVQTNLPEEAADLATLEGVNEPAARRLRARLAPRIWLIMRQQEEDRVFGDLALRELRIELKIHRLSAEPRPEAGSPAFADFETRVNNLLTEQQETWLAMRERRIERFEQQITRLRDTLEQDRLRIEENVARRKAEILAGRLPPPAERPDAHPGGPHAGPQDAPPGLRGPETGPNSRPPHPSGGPPREGRNPDARGPGPRPSPPEPPNPDQP